MQAADCQPFWLNRYCVVQHIARSLARSPQDLFGMLSSYFDSAGGKDHGFIVVAGWVSSASLWERFENDWRLALAQADVPYFHMKEFSQSKGPFKSWKGQEGKRMNFLSTLAQIIKDYTEFGTCTYLDLSLFETVNQMYCLKEWVGNGYSFAGRECAVTATLWASNRCPEALPLEFFFEEGDEGQGTLEKLMVKDGFARPIFRPSRDKKVVCCGVEQHRRGVIQLQAADFAAYELRKAKGLLHMNAYAELHRASFLALTDAKTNWRTYADTRDRLIRFCQEYKIPRRSAHHACSKRLV